MLVLASRSPRRREILEHAGIPFIVRPMDVDETPLAGEGAHEYVNRIARRKAEATQPESGEIILAADTTVTVDGQILAKPEDARDAGRMLRMLSGRCHEVLTGICLRSASRTIEDRAETRVWFAPLSRQEIDDYVASGEPVDKAGAYAIQGLASRFVTRLDGCYFNVMGLPVSLVYRHLREMSHFT